MSKGRQKLDISQDITSSPATLAMSCAPNNLRNESEADEFIDDLIPANEQLVCFSWNVLHKENSHNIATQSSGLTQEKDEGVKVFSRELHIPCKEKIELVIEHYSDKEKAFNNADNIYDKIVKLIEKGFNVAVLDDNNLPDIINYGLEKIGFSEKHLSKMYIIYGVPAGDRDKIGMMEHVAKAKELFGVKDNQNVILVDNLAINTVIAAQGGIKYCYVTDYSASVFMKEVMAMVRYEERDSALVLSLKPKCEILDLRGYKNIGQEERENKPKGFIIPDTNQDNDTYESAIIDDDIFYLELPDAGLSGNGDFSMNEVI